MAEDLENIEKLLARFKRQIPEGKQYQERLVEEFELIINLRFTDYFLQICDIIDLTTDIKHMTRAWDYRRGSHQVEDSCGEVYEPTP